MTRLILALQDHHQGHTVHRVIEQLPAVVGRGFDCDVIVTDLHVAPRQFSLRQSDTGGWDVADLGGLNPTRLNGHVLAPQKWTAVSSGDTLTFGRSTATVFAAAHEIAPTLPIAGNGGIVGVFSNTVVSAMVFVAALLLSAGWAYLEVWSDEAELTSALVTASAFFVMVIWAALWSVVGRLLAHRAQFMTQLGMVALYVIFSLFASTLMRRIDFLLSGNMLAQALSLAAQAVMLALLVYGCLGVATSLARRKRWQGAVSFAAGLIVSIVSLNAISGMGFASVPSFASTLAPGLSQFAPAVTADEFMTRGEALFDDPMFSAKAPAGESDSAAPQQINN